MSPDLDSEFRGGVSPYIQSSDGDVEFHPISVERFGGTLPWNTDSFNLQCGETITETNGDTNIRFVFECICTYEQFFTLNQLRNEPNGIELVSAAYSGPVNFDELKFDRIADANGAVYVDPNEIVDIVDLPIDVDANGQTIVDTNQPIYKVLLQSKEDTGEN